MTVVYLNDRFVDYKDAVVSVEDRGFNFADGIYEVIKCYNGKTFCLGRHLDRLMQGLGELNIPLEMGRDRLAAICEEALKRTGEVDASIYVQITRGPAPRNHAFPKDPKPTVLVLARGVEPKPKDNWVNGVSTVLYPDIRWERCFIKTLQLLPNCMAKDAANKKGAYEAIMHRDDTVTEASSSNVFIVKNGEMRTHPADEHILHGITRAVTIELAKEAGMNVAEQTFTVSEMLSADEVFLSGTSTEIMPVIKVDDTQIGSGRPGSITKELQAKYKALTENL
jgi:D-alanine transaminase